MGLTGGDLEAHLRERPDAWKALGDALEAQQGRPRAGRHRRTYFFSGSGLSRPCIFDWFMVSLVITATPVSV